MAAAILNTSGQCDKNGFYQSQVRVVIVNGVEIYQCEECFVKNDNGGQNVSINPWRKLVGESRAS
eukprot:4300743-Karenia_brevis.AAC.1